MAPFRISAKATNINRIIVADTPLEVLQTFFGLTKWCVDCLADTEIKELLFTEIKLGKETFIGIKQIWYLLLHTHLAIRIY